MVSVPNKSSKVSNQPHEFRIAVLFCIIAPQKFWLGVIPIMIRKQNEIMHDLMRNIAQNLKIRTIFGALYLTLGNNYLQRQLWVVERWKHQTHQFIRGKIPNLYLGIGNIGWCV